MRSENWTNLLIFSRKPQILHIIFDFFNFLLPFLMKYDKKDNDSSYNGFLLSLYIVDLSYLPPISLNLED
jgi:hypothetical protein